MSNLSRAEIEYRQTLMRMGLPVEKPPEGQHIWMHNTVTDELKVSNCKKWSCERCAPKLSTMWAVKILGEHVDYFLTMTLVPEKLESARWSWREFCQAWRRKYGALEYVKFTERGSKTLMKHYHVLIRSAAPEIDLQWLRDTLIGKGYGLQNKLRRMKSGEHRRRTVWYCAKYISKSGTNGFLETERKVEASRGFFIGHESMALGERIEWEMEQECLRVKREYLLQPGHGDPTYRSLETILEESRKSGIPSSAIQRMEKLLARQKSKSVSTGTR